MKKNFIAGVVIGGLLFGSIGVFAGQYVATDNPFPVQLNGNNVSIEGYNIEGSTYFKLRDIADTVGGFSVDFNNDTIQLSKDGYVYENSISAKLEFTDAIKNYFSEYGIRIPAFTQATLNSDEFVKDFVFYYYTGIGDPNTPRYHDGYFDWNEVDVRAQYKLLFGAEMPLYYPTSDGEHTSVIYNNGNYSIMSSNYGDEMYVFDGYSETSTGLTLKYAITDSTNAKLGYATFDLAYADNENKYIITSKSVAYNIQ